MEYNKIKNGCKSIELTGVNNNSSQFTREYSILEGIAYTIENENTSLEDLEQYIISMDLCFRDLVEKNIMPYNPVNIIKELHKDSIVIKNKTVELKLLPLDVIRIMIHIKHALALYDDCLSILHVRYPQKYREIKTGLLINLLYTTGIGLGDALNIRNKDITLHSVYTSKITIVKNNHIKYVYAPSSLIDNIWKIRNCNSSYLFSQDNGDKTNICNESRKIKRLIKSLVRVDATAKDVILLNNITKIKNDNQSLKKSIQYLCDIHVNRYFYRYSHMYYFYNDYKNIINTTVEKDENIYPISRCYLWEE